MRPADHLRWIAVAAAVLCPLARGNAQANLPLYTDRIVNAFQDWSYNATLNFANTSPVKSGSDSIAVTVQTNYGALFFHQWLYFDTGPYTHVTFWINGGPIGGQPVTVSASTSFTGLSGVPLDPLPTNSWRQITLPLSALGVDHIPNFAGLTIQGGSFTALPTFYVDDVQLVAAPAPAQVHVSVDATQTVRTADARWFGVNTATWDSNLSQPITNILMLTEMGCLVMRWPGGSTSDTYHWSGDNNGNFRFRYISTNVGAQVFTTVNYGSGTSNEAAAWVRNANVTNHCNFKYWEIGNECYGTWEADSNSFPHDPYTYAVRAAGYMQMMRAADPTIKVGVVVVPFEESYNNGYNSHPAFNPRTGQTHNGWTPVMLSTLKSLGVLPDFAIYHYYPEYTDPNVTPVPVGDGDPILLQASVNWAHDAADLRQQITDYVGAGGTNIELVCTENNSDPSSAFGRQLTSIVNALYLADSVSQLMKTEFNALIWWDWRNSHNSKGTFDPTIYGWRTFGDEGMIDGIGSRYPTFYAEKILQWFVRPGDTVLNAASDYSLLGAYAARRTNGALSLLVINKDATTNFTAQLQLANFVPWPVADIRSYGIPQDEAVRTNGPAALQNIQQTNYFSASTSFNYSFPPYSLTVITFAPDAARLRTITAPAGKFVLELQGQSGVPYVLQSSSNLFNWTSISTNLLPAAATLKVTNTIPAGSAQQFWRAMWQP